MRNSVIIFESIDELCAGVLLRLQAVVTQAVEDERPANIVLAGGSTARLIYQYWAKPENAAKIPWEHVQLFWGDERCVSPYDEASNFRMVQENLLNHVEIPAKNIHRMRGEAPAQNEADRYGEELIDVVPIHHRMPRFDWILLGLGSDGHTASLFPGGEELHSHSIVTVAIHPKNGQQCLTLTPPVLTNAERLSFLVTGAEKAEMLEKVHLQLQEGIGLPAGMIASTMNTAEWLIDQAAAAKLRG
jgi:6-phosphogluconolactonase